MSQIDQDGPPQPPVGHARVVYLGPVAPHWEVHSDFGDEPDRWPNKRGFDEMFIHGCGGIGQSYPGSCGDAPGNTYFDPAILHNGKFEKTKGYCTDVFFNQATRWIESVKGKNLGDGAWIVAHFGDADDVLFMDGPVVLVTDKAEQEVADRDYTAKHINQVTGVGYSVWDVTGNALFRLDPTRIVTWNDGNARGRTEWRFD